METNKIYQGDCLELMKELEDNSIDLVITSPPYKNSYEGIGINRGSKTAKYHYSGDVGEPLYLIEDFGEVLFSKLKDEGILLLNLGYNKDSGALRPFYIIERLLKNGWFCPDVLIWHKKNPIPNTAYQLTNAIEYFFVLTKRPTYKLKIEERKYIHNVFNFPVESGETEHNAAYNLKLIKELLKYFSREKDLIIDCFMGSGTTALAAKQLNRKYIGFEINPEYVKLANKRIEEVKQEAMQSEARHSSQA